MSQISSDFQLGFAITSNFILSILLVLINKAIVVQFQFKYMTVLSTLHFLVSALVCMGGVMCSFVPYRPVNNYFHVFRIALGSVLSIVFMNYCLATSSIGFYQISKLGTIPMTLILEIALSRSSQKLSGSLICSLIIVIIGMSMVIQQEIKFNSIGLLWAFVGIITTSAAQVFFGTLKKKLGLDSLQLLFHTSPWLTFGSFFITPLFDNMDSLYKFNVSGSLQLLLLGSSVVAVAFNVSNYSLLTMVSPLTYSLLGHVKTIALMITAAYFFNSWPSQIMVFGMVIAILGVIMYGQVVEAQKRNDTPASTPTRASVVAFKRANNNTDIESQQQRPVRST